MNAGPCLDSNGLRLGNRTAVPAVFRVDAGADGDWRKGAIAARRRHADPI